MRMIGGPAAEHSSVCYASGTRIIKYGSVHCRIGGISLLNVDGYFRTVYLMEDYLDTRILSLIYYNVYREMFCSKGHLAVDWLKILSNELSAVLAFVVDADKLSVL